MGKRKQPKIVQQRLDYSELSVSNLIEEIKATNVRITWSLKNYSKLKEDKTMQVDVSLHKDTWKFEIQKTKSHLEVTLSLDVCNRVNSVDFGIANSDGKMLEGIACSYKKNKLSAQVENKTILDPEKKLLNDDILILKWEYTARPYENNIVLMPGWQSTHYDLMQNYHADSLCNDLKDLFLGARFTDFIITFNRAFFEVHKFILCSRSTYFERMANEYPNYNYEDFKNNINPNIMYEVLLYMYSGHLTDMSMFEMTDVFDIACSLEIWSLIEVCKDFFKANLSVENLIDITTIVTEYEVTEVGEEIKKFLDSQPESVLQSDRWKGIFEEVRKMLNWMDRNTNNLITIKTVEIV